MATVLADDTFKRIFLNENVKISIKISLKFVPKVQLTIFQHWLGQWLGADKPLFDGNFTNAYML